jgi:hypothetical protein
MNLLAQCFTAPTFAREPLATEPDPPSHSDAILNYADINGSPYFTCISRPSISDSMLVEPIVSPIPALRPSTGAALLRLSQPQQFFERSSPPRFYASRDLTAPSPVAVKAARSLEGHLQRPPAACLDHLDTATCGPIATDIWRHDCRAQPHLGMPNTPRIVVNGVDVRSAISQARIGGMIPDDLASDSVANSGLRKVSAENGQVEVGAEIVSTEVSASAQPPTPAPALASSALSPLLSSSHMPRPLLEGLQTSCTAVAGDVYGTSSRHAGTSPLHFDHAQQIERFNSLHRVRSRALHSSPQQLMVGVAKEDGDQGQVRSSDDWSSLTVESEGLC